MTDEIWILMARKQAGEASEEDLRRLRELVEQDMGLQYSYTIMERLEECREQEAITAEEENELLQHGWSAIEQYLESRRPEPPLKKRWWARPHISALAAGFLLLLAASGVYVVRRYEKAALKNEITTDNGSRTAVVLPDGTRVRLNVHSRLQYPDRFTDGSRVVTLEGEGFFEVKKDPSHPFIIRVNDAVVRVLGTSLNVKAYPEDDRVETTLISGKVAVDLNDDDQREIILKPNQKITLYRKRREEPAVAAKKDAVIPLHRFDVSDVHPRDTLTEIPLAETAWTENTLTFDQKPLGQLSHDLERWYGVKIIFKNDLYRQQLFTGTFKNQPINEVMHALQLSSDFHYRIDSLNKIYIW
ncbi:FecR family protein [Compostibacter hankyongensis]|uniref:FecR family protein n=1 Tax=Compostibacter hankyongensis TaxID=1007089 RepID=A0ABP8FVT5_9BACT